MENNVNIKVDHFCIMVDDLLTATRNFEALGFIVTQGSNTGGKSGNALIVFENKVCIELVCFGNHRFRKVLLALTEPTGLLKRMFTGEKTLMRRFLKHWTVASKGVWADWCLAATPLEDIISAARKRGLELAEQPFTHERFKADGGHVKWRMGGGLDVSLPFLIEEIEDSAERVPIRLNARHPNGARRLTRVILGSAHPEQTIKDLEALTGLKRNGPILNIDGVEIKVEQDSAYKTALPKELIFCTDGADFTAKTLDTALTGGAAITVQEEGDAK
ncbi:MAG: VOC family protein [Pseudomonadota bacterium]